MPPQNRSDFWILSVKGDGYADANQLATEGHYCCYEGGSRTMTVYVRRPGGDSLYPILLKNVIVGKFPSTFSMMVFERLQQDHGYKLRGDPKGMSVDVLSSTNQVLFRCTRHDNDIKKPFVVPTEFKYFY